MNCLSSGGMHSYGLKKPIRHTRHRHRQTRWRRRPDHAVKCPGTTLPLTPQVIIMGFAPGRARRIVKRPNIPAAAAPSTAHSRQATAPGRGTRWAGVRTTMRTRLVMPSPDGALVVRFGADSSADEC